MKKEEKAKERRVLGRRLAEEIPKNTLEHVSGGKFTKKVPFDGVVDVGP